MKSYLQVLFLSVALFFTEGVLAQYIQVDDTYTAEQLVQNVLVNSTCASISNVSVSGGNFGTGQQSFGYFDGTMSSFPFANGLVLSTGKATSSVGPNTTLLSEGSTAWLGDADLQQALNITGSINATILEFDFTPVTNSISFNYIFSSEQYLTNPSSSQCNYTDGFAFLLKQAGTADQYQNLAIIPGTSIPVKVNTVRGSGTTCPPANEMYFGGFNGTEHPTNFNGQTIVMKAEADVISGVTYHIKLVIADQGNNLYDSAIFLGGGSFKSTTNLGIDRLVATDNPYCNGEIVTLNAFQPGTNTYKWFKDGVEVLGENNSTYTITDNTNTDQVTYSVEVIINGLCSANGDVTVQFSALPVLSNQTLVQCDDNGDGTTTFNLTKLDNLIKSGDTTIQNVVYYETIGGSPIANATSYVSTNKTIYVEAENRYGCKSTASVTLQIANNPIPLPSTIKKCDDDGTIDGKRNFDLSTEVSPRILFGLPSGLSVQYYASENDALIENIPLLNIFNKETPEEESIFARITNGPDCYGIIEVKLEIIVFNPDNFQDETLILCDGNTITLSIDSGFNTYHWSNGDSDFQTDITSSGNYTVEVTNVDGCKATKKFIVTPSAAATNINAQIVEFSGNHNTVLITYTDNGGDYVFSIDGTNYQESPYFTNIPAGEYIIYVKDNGGCFPIPSKPIYVLDYPKFFTPNGDGIHDTWIIKNIKTRPNTTINIFDRFGKLLKQLDSNSSGWNGTFNGQNLPSGDYWFTLTLLNGNTVKSNFTLKR